MLSKVSMDNSHGKNLFLEEYNYLSISLNNLAKKLRVQEDIVKKLHNKFNEHNMPAQLERNIQMKFGDLFD